MIGTASLAALQDDIKRTVELLKEASALLDKEPVTNPSALEALSGLKDALRESPSLLARGARKLAAALLDPDK